MKFFCDIISNEILPEIRANVSRVLFIKYGWSQERIANALCITQSAVSQYIKYKKVSKTIDVEELCDFIVSHGNSKREISSLIWKRCVQEVKKRSDALIPKDV